MSQYASLPSLEDTCAYGAVKPDRKLSTLYCRFKIPDGERVRITEAFQDSFRFSMIAGTETDVPHAIKLLLGDLYPEGDDLPNARKRKIMETNWTAVWSQCKVARVEEQTIEAQKRARTRPRCR
jgi:hypothetical protein